MHDLCRKSIYSIESFKQTVIYGKNYVIPSHELLHFATSKIQLTYWNTGDITYYR